MSYLKGSNDYVVVMYCKCWWPVCTGCCSVVRYVVQLSSCTQLDNVTNIVDGCVFLVTYSVDCSSIEHLSEGTRTAP
jgi:hypothetical protein